MFEFDKYEKHLHTGPPVRPLFRYEPVTNIEEMSLLSWGEHCVECAAPACYSSCDLYQARTDTRCRRLEFGAYRNDAFPSLRGYGAEIGFKRWGKIEARGNTRLDPVESVLKRERLLNGAAGPIQVAGDILHGITRDDRFGWLSHALLFERLGRSLHRRGAGQLRQPEAFLLEVYNPGNEPIRMHLSMTLSREERLKSPEQQLAQPFSVLIVLPRGYSRHSFDYRLFQSIAGSRRAFDIALIPESEQHARLVFLTADFVRYREVPASRNQPKEIKCVVWDLDNTLWDGVLIETEKVVLNAYAADLLKYFDERGILLSIASKNDHASAWNKLTEFGLADYFLYPKINWNPKSQNVKALAGHLNIGLDTFAFVDDNPFELAEVSNALPEVACIPVTDIARLPADPRFQGSTSSDARNRRKFYQEALSREQAETESGADFLDFLASCAITLEVAPYQPEELDRVAELVQRTNQLNFSGRKYSRSELFDLLEDSRLDKYVLRCSDKFGSYGTVAFSIVEHRPPVLRINDFMMSCRVQGKFLEQAFFAHLLAHDYLGASSMWVNFRSAAHNQPARNVLESLQFGPSPDGEGMVLESAAGLACQFKFIRVVCSAGVALGSDPAPSGAGLS
jgi:FkbH-like protein